MRGDLGSGFLDGPGYNSANGGTAVNPMVYDPRDPFTQRVALLPRLGLGISTEFGAGRSGLDLVALRLAHPELVQFLEIGCDLERGVDGDAAAWVSAGWPTTYHFLDLNLEEGEDLDGGWIAASAALARELGSAWMCGDAGLWHVGKRERGHGILMPPILDPSSADHMAFNVAFLRHASALEVLPENPPAHVYLGEMHLLDYYARVAERADSGLLLDVAHLAVFQRVRGHRPTTALDGFPLERVVEMHVAGGTPFEHGGRIFIDDDHGVDVLPDTWQILEAALPRARNLRALVFECERNRADAVLPVFARLRSLLAAAEA
jgi:uncharacterized protein (UPF0276 family)